MENRTLIVAEGEFDADVLKILLQNYESNFVIDAASGFSSALSTIRTVLSLSKNKIIAFLDSDSCDENKISERKEFVNFYVGTHLHRDKLKIVWAIPEFEIIFLNNQKFLKKFFNQVPENVMDVWKNIPKQFFLKYIGHNFKSDLLEKLFKSDEEIKKEFLNDNLIKEIINFS